MNMIGRYRRWFEYEKDAHEKVLASLLSVPQERRNEVSYQKIFSLFGHMMAARMLWLYRFGVTQEAPKDFFPHGLTHEDLRSRLNLVNQAWSDYFVRLDEAELARVFEYRSLEGGLFRNSIEDILTQLFGHSWYHRGQIAALVKSLGGVPAVTDFVFWTRESL